MKTTFNIGLCAGLFALLLVACESNSAPDKGKESLPPSPVAPPKPSSKLETVEETDPEGNTLQFTRRDSDGLREGLFTKTNSKGVKIEEATYRNGQLNGQRVLFYPNGDTLILESYQNDSFEGVYKSFYPKEKIKMLGQYHHNAMEGAWVQYYETGALKEEVLFSNNMENGPFKEYHPNGKPSVEGKYKEGPNEEGTLKFYNESGVHFKTMECINGVCRTVWSQEKGNEGKKRGKKS